MPPPYQDPLADISGARGIDVPADVAVRAGPKVAFTFGSNVERWVKYQDDGAKFAASMGAGKKLLTDGDPQNIIDGGVTILRKRYPRIQLVDDLATAARQRYDTTIVFDVKSTRGILPGSETTSDLMFIVLDAQQRPVSRLTGRGTSVIRAYVTPSAREAPERALAELDAKSERLLG